MKEKLLHTPEGVRDIYNSEYIKKFKCWCLDWVITVLFLYF